MLKPISGKIQVCTFCGEQTTGSNKYCTTCRTQAGRKEIFNLNVDICKENAEKGFKVPETLKSWK